jgi:hypothetical protein
MATLLFATAVYIVKLVKSAPVLAFAAIDLVPLPIYGPKKIVAIPAIDDVVARVICVNAVTPRPGVDDVIA